MRAYPELQWEEWRFLTLPRMFSVALSQTIIVVLFSFACLNIIANIYLTGRYWWKNRRRFLEAFATKRGFDVLDPDPWYSVTREMLLAENVCFALSPSILTLPFFLLLI